MMPCPACGRGDVFGEEPAFESLSPLLAALKSPPIAGGEGDVLRDAIIAGLQAFCANTPDFAMSSAMRRDAADFILGQPGLRADLPADVRRLVIAARVVAFEDVGMEAMAELDAASEAFADRVKWDDEPAEECVGGVEDAVEVLSKDRTLADIEAAVRRIIAESPDQREGSLKIGQWITARMKAAAGKALNHPTTSGDVGKLCEELQGVWEFIDHLPMDATQHHLNTIDAAVARIAVLEKALERLEAACDTVAGLRTQEMYLAMIDAGQEDALSDLGDARQAARALLNPTPTETTREEG